MSREVHVRFCERPKVKLLRPTHPALARAAATPEMKRLTDDGALFIGRIKSYIVEEKIIVE